MKRIVAKLKLRFPTIEVIIRADSGFSGAGFYKLADQYDLKFCMGIAKNEVLAGFTKPDVDQVAERYLAAGKKHQQITGSFSYQAKSWEKAQKVYAKVESTGKGMNLRYFVSNMTSMNPEALYYDFYVQRGEHSENRIKELKNMCYADRLSCHRYWPNFFRLMLSALCYEFFRQIKLRIGKTKHQKAKKWQVSNIRLYLLKVGAMIKTRVRQIRISFSKAFRYQELLSELLAMRC